MTALPWMPGAGTPIAPPLLHATGSLLCHDSAKIQKYLGNFQKYLRGCTKWLMQAVPWQGSPYPPVGGAPIIRRGPTIYIVLVS